MRFDAQHKLAILFIIVESYMDQSYITLVNQNIKFRSIVDLRVAMDLKNINFFWLQQILDSRMNLYLKFCMESESPMDMSVSW